MGSVCSSDSCAICQREIRVYQKDVSVGCCENKFHRKCMKTLIRSSPPSKYNCPLCRVNLSGSMIKDLSDKKKKEVKKDSKLGEVQQEYERFDAGFNLNYESDNEEDESERIWSPHYDSSGNVIFFTVRTRNGIVVQDSYTISQPIYFFTRTGEVSTFEPFQINPQIRSNSDYVSFNIDDQLRSILLSGFTITNTIPLQDIPYTRFLYGLEENYQIEQEVARSNRIIYNSEHQSQIVKRLPKLFYNFPFIAPYHKRIMPKRTRHRLQKV